MCCTIKDTTIESSPLSHKFWFENITWSSKESCYASSCSSIYDAICPSQMVFLLNGLSLHEFVDRELNGTKGNFSHQDWTISCIKALPSLSHPNMFNRRFYGRTKAHLLLSLYYFEGVPKGIRNYLPTWSSYQLSNHLIILLCNTI